ncbi:MAG: hypothetical protein J6T18_08465 [Bacteroidaceae bacterium]|nr:hypothetical protein [Bacteroidaceae bacterium]
MIEYIKLVTAFVVSIGGASVVIVALAKWFGDFLSHRLLDSYNNKHEKELEELKGKYANELEETKNELEKAKLQFVRYSEKQFELYNDLWKVLLYTKQQADMLWQRADPSQIPAFSEQIRLTRRAIDDNLLLIEDEHYNKLVQLIGQFEQFQFGKQKLIDIRTQMESGDDIQLITKDEAQSTIRRNKKTKDKYDELIMDIGKSFRNQIKG